MWHDGVAQRYNLTYRISNLGLRQLQKTRLLDQSASVLKSFAEETGELVRLAVVENGDRITWVYAVAGAKRTFQLDPNYTLEAYLHTTAIGKSWLATLPFETALKYMLREGMKPLHEIHQDQRQGDPRRARFDAQAWLRDELRGKRARRNCDCGTNRPDVADRRARMRRRGQPRGTDQPHERARIDGVQPAVACDGGAPCANLAARTAHASRSQSTSQVRNGYLGGHHAASRAVSPERRHSGGSASVQRRSFHRRALVPFAPARCRRDRWRHRAHHQRALHRSRVLHLRRTAPRARYYAGRSRRQSCRSSTASGPTAASRRRASPRRRRQAALPHCWCFRPRRSR